MSSVEMNDAELEGIGHATVRAAMQHADWPDAMSSRVGALPPVESRSRLAFGSDRTWQRDVWLRVEFQLRQRHYGLPREPATEAEHADVLRRAKYAIAQTLLAPLPVEGFHVEGVVDAEDELNVDEERGMSIRFAASFILV